MLPVVDFISDTDSPVALETVELGTWSQSGSLKVTLIARLLVAKPLSDLVSAYVAIPTPITITIPPTMINGKNFFIILSIALSDAN
jgi:hypothetical protein